MNSRTAALKETAIVASCELAIAGFVVIVYALLGKLSASVWLGAIAGALLAVFNYFVMAITAGKISDSAVATGETKSGQGAMRLSYLLRLIVLFAVLVILAKLKIADPIAAIIPLLLMQPIILLTQYLCHREVK